MSLSAIAGPALAVCLLGGCDLLAYDMVASGAGLTDGGATLPDGGADAGTTEAGPCANHGGCSALADCNVAGDTRTCSCKAGYDGDGVTCADVDECATGTPCDASASCVNTPAGAFTCTCATGFQLVGKACVDIDECAATSNGGCPVGTTCHNLTGSRECLCAKGYTSNGTTCVDVNECDFDNGDCSQDADCQNTPGSRTCACKAGFEGDGVMCTSCGACALKAWTKTTSFAINADYGFSAFALGERLVILGGNARNNSAGVPVNTMWSSTLNADGTAGPFSQSSRQLLTPHEYACLARDGDRLYIGGSWYSTEVEFLSVANNVVGAWTSTTSLPATRIYGGRCAVLRGALYVFGSVLAGAPGAQAAPTYRGVIAGDGTIAAWETLPGNGLPWYFAASFQVGNRLYLVGGEGTGGSKTSVTMAEAQPDGSIVWTDQRELPSPKSRLSAVVFGNRVYVADTKNQNGGTGELLTSVIAEDGSLGPWQVDEAPASEGNPALTATSTRLYGLYTSTDVFFTTPR